MNKGEWISKTWPSVKGCLDCLYDKCPSKYINLKVQGVELWEGRKDGKRKKGKEV